MLRPWREEDLEPFAALNSDPEVMRFFPGLLDRERSDSVARRIAAGIDERGWGLWAAELPGSAAFLGFIGLTPVDFEAPFTPAVEVGWRLARAYWGRGYAPEGARAALSCAFDAVGLDEVVSMTIPANRPSRRVMEKLGMHRDPADDFDHPRVPDWEHRRHVLYRLRRAEWVGRGGLGQLGRHASMEQRNLGRTGKPVSVVGLGTWQLGGDWGDIAEETAFDVLDAAVDAGVTLLDTADVYGDGRSEQLIGRYLGQRPDAEVFVATKMGRRVEQIPENYVLENFRAWTDRSRRNLQTDTLDLVQLHCPPTAVYRDDEVFDALDTLVSEGRIAAYGVSVETVEEALLAVARPGVATIQIILNAFRQKPLDEVLPAAARAAVGILARVPLASGLLSGRYTRETTFPSNDHRNYNRHGEAFDVGETFSGVDYETGVDASHRFAELARDGVTPAQLALRWVIDQPGVSSVIPGARTPEQARGNAAAAALPALDESVRSAIRDLYDAQIRPLVHDRW